LALVPTKRIKLQMQLERKSVTGGVSGHKGMGEKRSAKKKGGKVVSSLPLSTSKEWGTKRRWGITDANLH